MTWQRTTVRLPSSKTFTGYGRDKASAQLLGVLSDQKLWRRRASIPLTILSQSQQGELHHVPGDVYTALGQGFSCWKSYVLQ